MLINSPLSLSDIQKIDATELPSMERHYLRLLAHCLFCFKEIANGSSFGALPSEEDQFQWLLAQPTLSTDKEFAFILLEQFALVANQLERLAEEFRISPLELTLDELIISSSRD